MDDKGIGTDATIAEHIAKILQRGYAIKENNLFKPTDLGLALYDGYESMGYHMMRVSHSYACHIKMVRARSQ
jgi:DNA topoisomerase-3